MIKNILHSIFKIPYSIYKWSTANRLRKILSSILAILMLLTSIRFIFLKPKEVLADSLFTFDEGYGTSSAVHDSTGSVSAGSITNANWKTEDLCYSGKCLFFNGTSAYVSLGDNFDFPQTADFTIEFWFRTGDITSGTRTMVSKYRGNDTEGGYQIYMSSDGKVNFGVDDDNSWGPDDRATSTNAYDDNLWHHIAAVKTDTAKLSLYIDSALVAEDVSISATGTLENNDNFLVGAGITSGGSYQNYYTGFLDELKVYTSTARTASEVKGDVAGSGTGLGSSYGSDPADAWINNGLVGYWKMEEATNTTRADSSGNNNTLTESTGDDIDQATGKFGYGGDFENSSSEQEYLYITDANQTGLDITGDISLCTWIKPETVTTATLIGKNWNNYTYDLSLNSDGSLEMDISNNDGSSRSEFASATGVITAGSWFHVCATYDHHEVRIYINGKISGTPGAYSLGIYDDPTSNFYVGGGWGGYFDGVIDEARVYNRALSSTEVSELYNWAPKPTAWWKFDENTGTTAYDSSGNGNSGTLGAGTTSYMPAWTPGKFGSSLNFDGTNDYTDLGSSTFWYSTKPMTISFWTKVDGYDVSTYPVIINLKSNLSTGFRIFYSDTTNYTGIDIGDDGTNYINAHTSVDISSSLVKTWKHIEVVYIGSSPTSTSSYTLYVDGVPQTLTSAGGVTSPPQASYIGSSDLAADHWFDGIIDDVKIYNYARTPDQIVEDMQGGHRTGGTSASFGPDQSYISDGLVGYWEMDESTWASNCSTESVLDSSGNGNDGAPCLNGDAPTLSAGKFGNGGNFDGVNNYIGVNDSTSLRPNNGSWSISVWAQPTNTDQSTILAIKYNSTVGEQYFLGFCGNFDCSSSGQKLTGALIESEGVTQRASLSSSDDIDTNWHLYTMVADKSANKIKLYKDGVELTVTTSNYGSWPTVDNTDPLSIGGLEPTPEGPYGGNMDELRIYNRALSPSEVSQLYNWAPGPVGQWKMDENTGSTAYNSAPATGNYNITLAGSNKWVSGKEGSALKFASASDSVTAGDINEIDGVSAFTISAWMKEDMFDDWANIITKYGSDTNYMAVEFGDSQGTIYVDMYNSTNGYINVSNAYSTGQWFYLTVIYNGSLSNSERLKIYINGIIETATVTGTIPTTNGANSANVTLGPLNSSAYDDLKIYNYARTPAQIVEDMNAGHPAPGSPVGSPVIYYKFDENHGDTAHNSGSSGSVDDGTLINAMWWTKSGKYGSAVYDDNIGDDPEVQLPHLSTAADYYEKPGYTVCSWIYPFSDGENDEGHFWDKEAYDNFIGTTQESNGTVKIGAGMSLATSDASYTTTRTIPINVWSHICVTWNDDDDDELTIYINGEYAGSSTNGSGSTVDDTENTGYIGGSWDRHFDGKIDEFKIYNFALTANQVKVDYNHGATAVMGTLSTTYGGVTNLGETGILSTPDSGNGNYITATKYYLTQTSTIESLSFYVRATGGQLRLGIYDDDSGYPGTLKAETGAFTPGSTGWTTQDVTSPTTLSPGDYWIVYHPESDSLGFWVDDYGDTYYYDRGSFSALPGTFAPGADEIAVTWSFYATLNSISEPSNSADVSYCPPGSGDYCVPPIGEWKLDENTGTTAYDTSGYDNDGSLGDGTASYRPIWSQGKLGSSLKFDGVDDRVYVANPGNQSLEPPNSMTIEAWVYPTLLPQTKGADILVVKKNSSSGPTLSWDLYLDYSGSGTSANSVVFDWANSAGTNYASYSYYTSGTQIQLNQWQHIVGVRNGSTLKIYINGVESTAHADSPGAADTIYDSDEELRIGRLSGNEFQGYIDDIKLYDYARTPAQIAWDYNHGGPVGWWKFDEGNGDTANNSGSIGSSINGDLAGSGGSCPGASSCPTWTTSGKLNGALVLDGSDDYVDMGTSDTLWYTDRPESASFWTKLDGFSVDTYPNVLVLKTNSSVGFQIAYSDDSSGSGYQGIYFGNSTYPIKRRSAGDISSSLIGVWKHVVLTYNGQGASTESNYKLYVDGIRQNLTTTGGIADAPQHNYISAVASSAYFDGIVDDVKIFNYDLTPEQVKTEYNAGSALRFAPLQGSPE
jgi:hypothetical protein